jgi:squalene-associated FAD-dependent desaturase
VNAKPDSVPPRVAIIGAGWAGIACAVALTKAGVPVTLFEAGRQVGGRARTVVLDGRHLDNGQHLLLGAYRSTLHLLKQIGLDPDTVLTRLPLSLQAAAPGASGVCFSMQLPVLSPPQNLGWGLLRAKGISLLERWQLLRWMLGLQWQRFVLPQAEQKLTVAAWLRQHGQSENLCQQLWEPLCLAALNTPATRASAQIFANVLRDSLGSFRSGATDFLLPKVDLGAVLADPAVSWLTKQGATVQRGLRIRALQHAGNQWQLQTQAGKVSEHFDQVVIATAPQHALALLSTLPDPEQVLATVKNQLANFRYEPIATVYLEYPTALPLPQVLHLNLGVGQWLINRGSLGETAGKPGLIACVQSGQGAWETLDDAALCQALHQALVAVLGRQTVPAPVWQRVIREQRATFSCQPLLARPDFRPAPREYPGLWLAGDYTWADYPATLEGAVRSGFRAAEGIIKDCAKHR